ncbi:acyltransferase [Prolixibacteraceae bacterium JC049]|nr:acyltransferase [Prolixibacteraceae bacterium JC049]
MALTHSERRHDIDWLRVIAIALLIIYHTTIGFQPWGAFIGFIKNNESATWIWYPMAMLNMWRIPILFFVSGMGVCFSMRKRNLPTLLKERSRRILLPLAFGMLAIVPLHVFIFQTYYYQDLKYSIHQGHLWFLLNIFIYTIIVAPVVYLFRYKKISWFTSSIKRMNQPITFIVAASLLIIEALIVKPQLFTFYAFSFHGYVMGFIAFCLGFLLINLTGKFWKSFKIWKWVYLLIASILFLVRMVKFNMEAPLPLMALESISWIFAVLGFFYCFFNRPSQTLNYLKTAAYPIYIIHMIVQYGMSAWLFPLDLSATTKLLIIIPLNLIACLLIYELFIRRIAPVRFLMGNSFHS